MSLGERIREIRNQKGLSLREVAEKTGLSKSTISEIETSSSKNPTVDTLENIARALNVSITTFFENPFEDKDVIEKHNDLIKPFKIELVGSEIIETQVKEILALKLLSDGWSVSASSSIGDILAIKDNIKWYFEVRYFSRDYDNYEMRDFQATRNILYQVYGMLSVYEYKDISKFTIVVNSVYVFEILSSFIPNFLTVKISIMLIDLEKRTIVQEKELNYL